MIIEQHSEARQTHTLLLLLLLLRRYCVDARLVRHRRKIFDSVQINFFPNCVTPELFLFILNGLLLIMTFLTMCIKLFNKKIMSLNAPEYRPTCTDANQRKMIQLCGNE